MHAASASELAAVRWRHLSYIMQGSMSVLNPLRRVRAAFVDFAFRHINRGMPEFLDIVGNLHRLHLEPEVLHAYPHELPGGMRQRVAIALATVCRPDFVIADEPTTALDVVVQKGVLAMIREIQAEIGSSMLFVTHDLAVHANLCDRLGIMYAGRLVEEGRTAEVLAAPRHPYTAHLVASLPRIGDVAPKRGLEGAPPNLAAPPGGCRFHPRCLLVMEICRREVPPTQPAGPTHRLFRSRAVTSAPLLELSDVARTYTMGGLLSGHRIAAVDGVSFAIAAGQPEIFTIIGESGSGDHARAHDPEHGGADAWKNPVPGR